MRQLTLTKLFAEHPKAYRRLKSNYIKDVRYEFFSIEGELYLQPKKEYVKELGCWSSIYSKFYDTWLLCERSLSSIKS